MFMNSGSDSTSIRKVLSEYRIFIIILILGAIVWMIVFNAAAINFLAGSRTQPHRAVWTGIIQFDLLGSPIKFQMEGYIDYDYYYMSWGEQFLSGHIPYTADFDSFILDGTTYNTPFFLPPLYVLLCALGRLLPIQPFGIGALISIFGYMTAFPIYGIGKYLSHNPRIGEAAALTYLLNPLVLYHTVYVWLNPAPFVFFTMLSFYLLMKNRPYAGVASIVIAFMFKQTALFLGLPVVAYVLKKRPSFAPDDESDAEDADKFDFKGFTKVSIVAILVFLIISLPYLYDPLNYLEHLFVRPGVVSLDDFQNPPKIGTPIVMAVLFIVSNTSPELSSFINYIQYTSVGLLIGILPILGLMLIEKKDDKNLQYYWRRIFYLSLLLVLWLHLWSPRGIYKYYLVLLIPFLTILTSSRICSGHEEKIELTARMIVLPFILTLFILLPLRIYYLFFLFMIFLGYVAQRYFGEATALISQTIRGILRKPKM